MSSYAAAAFEVLQLVQLLLLSLENHLGLTSYLCPASSSIESITSRSSFDYVVVGGGAAGLALVHRLSETNATILLLEEGGCPPLESVFPGLFPLLPYSTWDYAMTAYNDSYACQNQKTEGGITIGKMLGGSAGLSHLLHVSPAPGDFDSWVEAANDTTWAYNNIIQYFVKSENVQDQSVFVQNTSWHGTDGPMQMKKQESSEMKFVVTAHEEMGTVYKNDSGGLCLFDPLLTIGDKVRQCGNVGYLSTIKHRPNLFVLTNARATKIHFNGTKATGVQYTHNDVTYNTYASRKVIISAGTILTPQLLMLSGIGNKTTLSGLGINTVVDNPHVGQNLKDHLGALLIIALDNSTEPAAAADPHDFPAQVLINHGALNINQSQPDVQEILMLLPSNSTGLLQLCTNAFKYLDPICDAWYKYNINRRVLLVATNLMRPKSTGSITLNATDITGPPVIRLGLMSNVNDLNTLAELLLHYFKQLLHTKAFKNLGAELADVGVCSSHNIFTLEFWKCYVLEMSTTYWHYIGTCKFGKVVDTYLNVIGTTNLKVVGAANIPELPSGKVGSYVRMLAEKAADIIKQEDGWIV